MLYNNKRTYVKLGQALLVLKSIHALQSLHKTKHTFLCGDFNFIPNSAIYHFLTRHQIDLNADIREFSNQKIGFLKNAEFEPAQLKVLNQKYNLFRGNYVQGGFNPPECVFSLNQHDNKNPHISPWTTKNMRMFEQLGTMFPIVDRFDGEIIFVQSEDFTENILQKVFQTLYPHLNYPGYRKNMNKKHNRPRRRHIVASVLNGLAKDLGLESSYHRVGVESREKLPETESFEWDVSVSQFSNDIKGILAFFVIIKFYFILIEIFN